MILIDFLIEIKFGGLMKISLLELRELDILKQAS